MNAKTIENAAASIRQSVGSQVAAVRAAVDTLRTSTLTVTGGLTNTELRAAAVPVSAASLPLPTGAATDAKLDTIIARLDTIITALGTLNTTLGTLATASAQTTGNTSLAAIQTSAANIKANGGATGLIATVA